MKKILILLGCVGLFIGFIAFVQVSLSTDAKWIDNKTQEIENAYSTPDEAQALYHELKEYWEKRKTFWGTLLPHDNLEVISNEIALLGVSINQQNTEDSGEAIVTLNQTMAHLLRRNTLRWDHIF